MEGKNQPNIVYGHANIMFETPGITLDAQFGDDWRDVYREGIVDMEHGSYEACINSKYHLQMLDIIIPTVGARVLSSEEAVADSVERIVGNLGDNLDRYVGILRENRAASHLYFTPQGMLGYSPEVGFSSRKIDHWVNAAKDYSLSTDFFPEDMELPEGMFMDNYSVELVPTFQRLRDLGELACGQDDQFDVRGDTFADRVDNFLKMYDAAVEHVKWIDTEESTTRMKAREQDVRYKNQPVKLSKLVLKK